MKEFDDVAECVDVKDFNDFCRQFLEDRKVFGEERRRIYWALFYKWKEMKR